MNEKGRGGRVLNYFLSTISPDAWIQSIGTLLGAFLGALIAGLITIKTMKFQFDRNKEELRVSELENFVMMFTEVNWTLGQTIANFSDLKEEIIKSNPDNNRIQILLKKHKDLSNGYAFLDRINDVKIPVNLHLRINGIKFLNTTLESLDYSILENGKIKEGTLKDFIFLHNKLIDEYKELKTRDDKAITEIKNN